MGLDQYAYYREPNNPEGIRILEWRKHYELQEWMENLWLTRLADRSIEDKFLDALDGEDSKVFNCVEIELYEEDIDSLENDFEEMHTSVDGTYEIDNDQMFIATARKLFSEGKQVFYDSWW